MECFAHDLARALLTEANLQSLDGVEVRRVRFEHDGRALEMVVPHLGVER